eukprot:8642324-Heterocapsa_arctica.AAC.1
MRTPEQPRWDAGPTHVSSMTDNCFAGQCRWKTSYALLTPDLQLHERPEDPFPTGTTSKAQYAFAEPQTRQSSLHMSWTHVRSLS